MIYINSLAKVKQSYASISLDTRIQMIYCTARFCNAESRAAGQSASVAIRAILRTCLFLYRRSDSVISPPSVKRHETFLQWSQSGAAPTSKLAVTRAPPRPRNLGCSGLRAPERVKRRGFYDARDEWHLWLRTFATSCWLITQVPGRLLAVLWSAKRAYLSPPVNTRNAAACPRWNASQLHLRALVPPRERRAMTSSRSDGRTFNPEILSFGMRNWCAARKWHYALVFIFVEVNRLCERFRWHVS